MVKPLSIGVPRCIPLYLSWVLYRHWILNSKQYHETNHFIRWDQPFLGCSPDSILAGGIAPTLELIGGCPNG